MRADLTKGVDRTALGFANHLSFYELALLFDRYGFRIECTTPIDETQVLMRLTPSEWMSAPAASSVAVISADDAGDFGSRLGRQMVNALLPGEAEVHHLTLRTLGEARGNYDLVVLGTGNGLFPTLLGEEVLDDRFARQGGDRHFRNAKPRADRPASFRSPHRSSRYLVHALRRRCADVRSRSSQRRSRRRLADRPVPARAAHQ